MIKLILLELFSSIINTAKLIENCTEKGVIAITFDDGPVSHTREVLEIAAEENVPLTFHFTVHQLTRGNLGNIYEQCVAEGHSVGLRVNPGRDYDTMSADEMNDDVVRQMDVLKGYTGKDVKYVRAPIDNGNANDDLFSIFMKNKTVQTSYNFCPYDYPDAMSEFENIIAVSNPKYDSFIVLLHDERESEEPYLKNIIKIGKKRGYKFVTLDECLSNYEPDAYGNNISSTKVRSTAGIESIWNIIPFFILLYSILY